MTDRKKVGQLAELLIETGRRHHEAFIETDGDDPEWPLWYAEYLQERVIPYLGVEPTRSKLVQCLLNAEEDHLSSGDDRPWQEFYARYILSLDESEMSSPVEPS